VDTQALLKRLYGHEVDDFEMILLTGDASNRRYHRVVVGSEHTPAQLMIMELPDDALESDEVTAGDMPVELPFLNVQRYMASAGLPVPEIYLDAVNDGAVLLEDLGDETFVARIEGVSTEVMEAWYGAAVDLMVRMHDRMWPVPEGCLAATRAFDYDLLRWELDHYREWGAEARSGRALESDLRGRLDRVFNDLANEIAALPRGFVHRDYQSRNLMVKGEDPIPKSLTIIDFQDALVGPRVYDLVALLNDSYVDVPGEMQTRIISRYAVARDIDPRALEREFDLVTIQRKLKDGGRFVFIDRVKGNPDFLPFVEKSFQRVRSALERLPGHDDLKKILARVDPEKFGSISS
jgi:aminoglycoside/choline kinase family phosphotransferase